MLYIKTFESSTDEQDYYTESDEEEISKHSPEPLNYDVFKEENP